jgi:hypothetical protein
MRTSISIRLLLGVAVSLAACEVGGDAIRANDIDRLTTSPTLAVTNLSSQVDSARLRVERLPRDISARENLVDLLLARSQFLGSYQDFDLVFETVNGALAMDLAPARTAVLHARVLSAVHEFDAALAELDRAKKLGVNNTEGLRQTIQLAQGKDPSSVLAAREALASSLPSYNSFTQLAAAQTAAQDFERADEAYFQALLAYRDVSPFPLAWVAFQRGVMWGERADDPDRAYGLYQVAVDRLPQYVVGNVHLSELEFAEGSEREAIDRLERIVNRTEDPEPASRLAQYLASSNPIRSAQYAEQADLGYQRLLAKYPLAFADHACEFYLGAGEDTEQALELALRNLDNRQTERAFQLAIRAAHATGNASLACELAEEGGVEEEGC